MTQDKIKIGATYRMRGRKCDRRVVDILWLPKKDKDGNYEGEYRMAVVQILGKRRDPRTVKEYLPWLADDVICEVGSDAT